MFTERPIFFQNKQGKHISHPDHISQNKRLEHHLSRKAAKLWLNSLIFLRGYSRKCLMQSLFDKNPLLIDHKRVDRHELTIGFGRAALSL